MHTDKHAEKRKHHNYRRIEKADADRDIRVVGKSPLYVSFLEDEAESRHLTGFVNTTEPSSWLSFISVSHLLYHYKFDVIIKKYLQF